jgi:monoamine oxidase
LIAGAGVAGLAAARMLTRSGASCLILEARHRIGGRVHTLYDPLWPVPVELGAEFVHGKSPEIWQAIESAPLPVVELSAGARRVRNGRAESADDSFETAEQPMHGMAHGPDRSFAEHLKQSRASEQAKQWAKRYVQGFHAARPELASAHALARIDEESVKIEGNRSFRLLRGYGSLIEWLRAGIDTGLARLRLGATVEEIEWKRGEVVIAARIAGSLQEFRGSAAIVTLPIGVLQSGAIRIHPMPDAVHDGCESIGAGHAIRVMFRFRRPIWEDIDELHGAGFIFSEQDWMPTWWTTLPIRAPVLTGWTGGPAAEAHAHESCEEWAAQSIAALARILSVNEERLLQEVDGWQAHNWAADPFARGAYSYVKVNGLEAQRRFSEPVEETLFFAGEANSEGAIGTVHGAMAAGERAARAVLERTGC